MRSLFFALKLLLLDGPMAALDESRKCKFFHYLKWLRDEEGLPIIHVSYFLPEVAHLASQIATLKEDKMISYGSAEDVMSDPFVQDFVS